MPLTPFGERGIRCRMSRVLSHLRLYDGSDSAESPPWRPRTSVHNSDDLANRELIRPPAYHRGRHRLEPFSTEWFDELEYKRFARHGAWLTKALEFGRHPGESILLLHPGLGSDALRFLQTGTEVTLAVAEDEDANLIRANFDRHGLSAPIVPVSGYPLPFDDGVFDVAVLNCLHASPDLGALSEELFRILKCGGKVIGLFPSHYDAGFWQDWLLPYQQLYWRRPADPTSAPKTTARELRGIFHRFGDHKVFKRQLRRSELPHLCRVLPLIMLERLLGRVLVLKAMKPISAARSFHAPLATDSIAA